MIVVLAQHLKSIERALPRSLFESNVTFASKTVGIELGVTCARIGQLRGGEVQIFRNAEGAEYTPSAVYFSKANSLVVGREAKERYESDPDNTAIEFKRDMGSETEFHFVRSGRRMRPEDLSAEVLKSLCGDVQRSTGEIVTAAVITVPPILTCRRTRRPSRRRNWLASSTPCS